MKVTAEVTIGNGTYEDWLEFFNSYESERKQFVSNEVIEKLTKIKPETISQASRISGITPVAIVSILRHLKRLAA